MEYGYKIKVIVTEFDLLCFLASHAGVVIDRNSLYYRLKGIDYDGLPILRFPVFGKNSEMIRDRPGESRLSGGKGICLSGKHGDAE